MYQHKKPLLLSKDSKLTFLLRGIDSILRHPLFFTDASESVQFARATKQGRGRDLGGAWILGIPHTRSDSCHPHLFFMSSSRLTLLRLKLMKEWMALSLEQGGQGEDWGGTVAPQPRTHWLMTHRHRAHQPMTHQHTASRHTTHWPTSPRAH